MLNYRLLLGGVAFTVSFGISLLLSQQFTQAVFSGAIAVPGAIVGAIAVEVQQRKQKNHLNSQVRSLAKYRDKLEFNLISLESNLNQLYQQVNDTYQQRERLNAEVPALSAYKYQLEEQTRRVLNQLQTLSQRETEINQSLIAIADEKRQAEESCAALRTTLNQLNARVVERQSHKESLALELTALQNQLQDFEQQKSDFNQSILTLSTEKQDLESALNLLQEQIALLRKDSEHLQNKISFADKFTGHAKGEAHLAELPKPKSEKEVAPEWLELMTQLTKNQLRILEILAKPENPSAVIKQIAEEDITMPELIIDAINEQALNTVNDLIIEPGSTSTPPTIVEEYLGAIKQAIAIAR